MPDVHPAETRPIAVAEFDSAPVADAAAELMPCCASRSWISQLVSGRPYGRLGRLSARSDAILAALDGPELADALATTGGLPGSELGPEQHAYEQRFGHPFLQSGSAGSTDALRSSLRSRLRNDPVAEREIARTELAKIVRRRLAATFR